MIGLENDNDDSKVFVGATSGPEGFGGAGGPGEKS
jgi:hypothetical protein